MPYTLKTSQISVKDPETGEYSGVDILAEQTEQGLIAELQAEGTTQVNRINQAAVDVQAAVDQAESDAATIISNTQTSINTLEAQKNTIAQTVASMAELGTDTTLSTPGMAADAGAVGDLSRQISDVTGNGIIKATPLGQYINLNGSTANINNPSYSTDANRGYIVVSCAEGDAFTINAVGGAGPRAYGFLGAADAITGNSAILEVALSTENPVNKYVVAPTNTAYLVINDNSGSLSYYGKLLKTQVSELQGNVIDNEKIISSRSEIGDNIADQIISDSLINDADSKIEKTGYCSILINGSVSAYGSVTVLNYGLSFAAGENYTFYARSKNGKLYSNWYLGITDRLGAYLKINGQNALFYLNDYLATFTPDSTITNARLFLTNNANEAKTINDEFYLYIAKGELSRKDFLRMFPLDFYNFREREVTTSLNLGINILYLYGDITGMSKDNAVTLDWVYKNDKGTAEVKWQGSSSITYEKKNYTVKFDHAIDVGWGSQKKYCMKANFIDHTHALNDVSAKLWSALVADGGTHPAIGSPNNGAVDGFPVIIALNGSFHGIYCWNIPKDKWEFGMGSESSLTEWIVTAENHSNATKLKSLALLDGTDFELEYKEDSVSETTIKDSLNTMIQAVIDASGSNWENSVNPYLDVDTAVDYYIMSVLINHIDGFDKNYILTTYDGIKWWFNAYDLDSTFGNMPSGNGYARVNSNTLASISYQNRIFELIYTYSKPKLVARYKELRSDILSEDNVGYMFNNFCNKIPSPALQADVEKYGTIPGSVTNTIPRVLEWFRLRCKQIDAEIDGLT